MISKTNKEVVTRAPELLDAQKLQNWLSISVYSLIGLNILALGLFLASLTLPKLQDLRAEVLNLKERWKTRKTSTKGAVSAETSQPAESIAVTSSPDPTHTAENHSAPGTETPMAETSVAVENSTPQSEEAPALIENPSNSPTAVDTTPSEKIPASTDVPAEAEALVEDVAQQTQAHIETAQAFAENSSEAHLQEAIQNALNFKEPSPEELEEAQLEDQALVLEDPVPPEAEAVPTQTAEAREPFLDKTEIITESSPELSELEKPVLPVGAESAENKDVQAAKPTTAGTAAFERSLEELLNTPTDQTEEIPIFDSGALDEIIKKSLEEETKT